MAPTCTWIVEGRVDTDGREFECGKAAYVVFSHKVKRMGKTVIQVYPRCRVHAPKRVVDMAREGIPGEDGIIHYDVKFLEDT